MHFLYIKLSTYYKFIVLFVDFINFIFIFRSIGRVAGSSGGPSARAQLAHGHTRRHGHAGTRKRTQRKRAIGFPFGFETHIWHRYCVCTYIYIRKLACAARTTGEGYRFIRRRLKRGGKYVIKTRSFPPSHPPKARATAVTCCRCMPCGRAELCAGPAVVVSARVYIIITMNGGDAPLSRRLRETSPNDNDNNAMVLGRRRDGSS